VLPNDASAPAASWPREGEDLCWLSGDFRILQRLDGHRWSLDDLMTAWLAAQVVSAPRTICDLGCGIGTVLLFLAWRFPQSALVGVEAQAESAALARRSLAWNAVLDRASVRDADLRDEAALAGDVFDLVTGTPPYFPPGTGVESSRPQCAPCRFEHRGGVEVYIDAIARVLAPGGRAVICQGAIQAMRVAPAVARAGLVVERRLEIVPRTGKPTLVSLFVLARASDAVATHATETLIVRERDGRWTGDFRRVRSDMGMPPGRHDET
jgi:tRNA1(Val) A37 N6-methylase TrmN6